MEVIMDKQEFLTRITAIGTCEDEVERRELLSALSEDVGKDYDNLASLSDRNKTLSDDNETLRSANMKLFLRVGESKDDSERKKDETGIDDKEKEKRDFKDLFNEKGELK